MTILEQIMENKSKGRKGFAVLLDPDKSSPAQCAASGAQAQAAGASLILVGGSLLMNGTLRDTISEIKKRCTIPVLLFPGSPLHIAENADGILFLSLISGRNAEMLIGHHVIAAPLLKKYGVQVLPTGYMLIDSGRRTSVHYMSNTDPIPADKPDIAAATALAGELLGLRLIYLDAGSGAESRVPDELIGRVAATVSLPIFVGGGIRSAADVHAALASGADMIVIGNALESENASLLEDIASAISSF